MQGSKQARILVAEDHPDSTRSLAVRLERMGYDVIEATDGEEVVKKALAESPDLIILDLWLTRMNAFQATLTIQEHPRAAQIPVIAYTSSAHSDCKAIALELGMSEFLLKPTPSQVLKNVIEKFVKKRP